MYRYVYRAVHRVVYISSGVEVKVDEHRNPNLKNKAVFTQRDTSLGVPTRVFVGTAFLILFAAVVFCSYLGWTVGLPATVVLALVIFLPVYLIHKDDPEAYVVWLRSMFTASRLSAVRNTRRRMLVLIPDGAGHFNIKTITQGNSK